MEIKHKAHITVLLKIAKFIGICPVDNPSNFGIFYQIFLLCVAFCFSLFSICSNCVNNYVFITPVHAFIDLFSSISATILGTSMQITALVYAKTWRKLIRELSLENENHSKLSVYLELFVINILFIATVSWNFYTVSIAVGWHLNKYYIHLIIHMYYDMIYAVLIIHINGVIKKRFATIRNKFLTCPTVFDKRFHHQIRIRQLTRAYSEIKIILVHFNCVFGYQILFILGCSVAVMLNSLCNALNFLDYSNKATVLILSSTTANTAFIMVFYNNRYLLCSDFIIIDAGSTDHHVL